jgi:hypothetical protein
MMLLEPFALVFSFRSSSKVLLLQHATYNLARFFEVLAWQSDMRSQA